MGIAVYVSHLASFLVPIRPVILNNAKGVNPEVSHTKAKNDLGCVLVYNRQRVPGNFLLVVFQIMASCLKRLRATPTVTQGYIRCREVWPWFDESASTTKLVEFQYSFRQSSGGRLRTFRVLATFSHALLDEVVYLWVVCMRGPFVSRTDRWRYGPRRDAFTMSGGLETFNRCEICSTYYQA